MDSRLLEKALRMNNFGEGPEMVRDTGFEPVTSCV